MKTWEDIPGWTDFSDVYAEAVQRLPKSGGILVEVGCWLGRSAALMATLLKNSGKAATFYVVDNFKGSGCDGLDRTAREWEAAGHPLIRQFLDNMKECGVEHLISPIVAESVEGAKTFPDGMIDFCFIDANHEAPAVQADIRAWWPKIKPGGVLAGHDANRESVMGPVREAFDGRWKIVGVHGMCWWTER